MNEIIEQREVLGKEFKIYGDFENPLFLAKDVAEWIDYSKTSEGYYNTGKMLMMVDDSEKVTITNGDRRGKTTFLTEDGLYEVLMQSRKPIAKQFKKQVKQILKEIRTNGSYSLNRNTVTNKDRELEIKLKNARTREANILLKIANDKDTEIIYKNILKAKAAEIISGESLLPLPDITAKTYTATDIANMLEISSANKVGKIANLLNLKAPEGEENEYGRWIHNKSKYSTREVKQWLYSEKGLEVIEQYVNCDPELVY